MVIIPVGGQTPFSHIITYSIDIRSMERDSACLLVRPQSDNYSQ